MSVVDEAIVMWETYRKGVIAELENIPEDDWDYRPAAEARTLREVARHIAELGVGFTAELTRADGTFSRLFDKQTQQTLMSAYPEARTKDEIIDLLRTTGQETSDRLRSATEMLNTVPIKMMSGQANRVTAMGFAMSHEMYHRGQLATYARGVGRVPALTQQIAAMLNRRK